MKRSGFASRLQFAQARREEDVRFHTRVYMMDLVTIALGRMGWGEKRFRQLNDMLTEVSREYCELILDDAKADRDIEYSKACMDREIARYVGTMFVPYEERYRNG